MAQFDTVIKNGMVIDGTGVPSFLGDLAIRESADIVIYNLDELDIGDTGWFTTSLAMSGAASSGRSAIATFSLTVNRHLSMARRQGRRPASSCAMAGRRLAGQRQAPRPEMT